MRLGKLGFGDFKKVAKRVMKNAVRFSVVGVLIISWVFSGWPQVWNWPPKPEIAHAVTTKFRQEINIIDAAVTASGDHSAIVRLDTAAYTGATYYFETVAKVTSGTLTVALERALTATQDSTISVTATSYTRQRSTAFTPPAGVTYYNINLSGGTGPSVQAARIIILQSADPLTNTQTQIEIGNEETGKTNTGTAALSNPKYWLYDSTKWDGSPTFNVQASFKHVQAASSTTYSTAGTYTYIESATTSYITIEAWGAGGGGADTALSTGGGGGGGGAYARSTTTASGGGTSHTLVVGAGQAADSTTAASTTYDTTVVEAGGGKGKGDATAGVGGQGIGQVKFAGGAGGAGNGTGDLGGGGGGAGGPNGNGNAGTQGTSGVPGNGGSGNAGLGGAQKNGVDGSPGGAGNAHATGGGGGAGADDEDGGTGDGQGGPGGAPGGGGGGGNVNTLGVGAAGQIILKETHGLVGIALEEDNGSFGGWTLKVQIATSTTATSTSATTTMYSFTPTTGRNYRLVASSTASTATYDIYNAKIIVDQTSPTLLETQYLIANTGSFGGATGLKDFDTLFDPAEWTNVGNTYIHEANGAAAGTGDVKLQQDPNGTPADITGSTITDVIEREQSGAMTMPGSSQTLDVNVTGTGTLNASRILAQVGPAPTDMTVSGNAYADEGTGDLSICDGAATNIAVGVGTSTPSMFKGTCADVGNAFTITLTDTSSLTAGTPLILYLNTDGGTASGTTVTKYSSGNPSGLIIRNGRLIVQNEATASTTENTNLGIWDNDNDTDINYTSNSGTLITEYGTKLIVGGDDTFATGGIASTTAGGASPGGDVVINSGATLSMGTNALRIGGNLEVYGTLSVSAGQTTEIYGTRSGGTQFGFGTDGATNFTFENLTIGGSTAITASSSFTVGSGDTLQINGGGELAIRSGKNATSSGTYTLNGTVSGSGTMVFTDTSDGPGSSGTLSAPVRFDATSADIASTTLDARTYTGLVEIYSDSASARSAMFSFGTFGFNAGLNVVATAAGGLRLLGTPNHPTANIGSASGNLDYTGTGAGSEAVYSGTGTWTVTGNADFTAGSYYASSTNTLVMNGTSKTLTTNSQGFDNVTLSGTITTSGALSATSTLILSGSSVILGSNASSTGDATLSGTVYHDSTTAVILGGLDKTITGGGTVSGLIIRGEYTLSGSDLTVGTSTVVSNASTTVGTGRVLTATSSIAVAGTIDGAGTTTVQSTLSGSGTINSNVQFDASNASISAMPARTYGGNVEIFNSNAAARTVTMDSGTHTVNGGGGLMARSTSGNITLAGDTNSAAATIANNLSCVSGGGTKTIATGATANTWAVSGNVDFTNCTFTAGSGNTLQMSGTSKTLTSASQTLNDFTVSGGSISLADALAVSGTLTVSGGTFADNGKLITLSGSSKNIDISGGAQTLHNLRISGTYTLLNNDLTISTSTIDTGQSLTVGAGRILYATSTLTIQGTGLITGAGTTTFGNITYSCSSLNDIKGTGLLSSNVRADATAGDCTLPARVFGSNLEIYSNSASNRVVSFPTGSSTVSSDLLVNSNSTGNATASSTATTELHVTRNLDYAGLGGGSEIVNHNTAIWYVSGNADFTGGSFTEPTASSTWIMNGSSKTLTAVAPFDNLYLTGSVTLASNASTTGDAVFSGTVTDNGNTVVLGSTDAENLVGGGNTLHSLWVRGPYTLVSSDLTISTSTVDSSQTLTVDTGRILISTSTMNLNGTIAGNGTTTFGNASFACSGVPSTGTLSVNVRADLSGASCTLPARVFGANLEIYNNNASARVATLSSASSTVVSALIFNANAAGNAELSGSANNPNIHINGNVDYIGGGGGSEVITSGTGGWRVSGDADFTGGTYTATAGNWLTMDGSSKTLTIGGAGSLSNLGASSTITISGNATTSSAFLIGSSGTVTAPGSTASLYIGGNYTNNGTFTHNSGKVFFNGGSAQTLAGTLAGTTGAFNDIDFSGAGSKTFNANASSSDEFTIGSDSGAVVVSGRLVTIGGVFTNNATFTTDATSLLYFSGSGNIAGTLIGSANQLRDIEILGTRTFTANASTSALTIRSGGTLTGPSGGRFTIAGNYTNDGTFTNNGATTTFMGTAVQTISGTLIGSTGAFYNLEIINSSATTTFSSAASTTENFYIYTPGAKVAFAASATTSIRNLLIQGSSGNEIRLWSGTQGTQWNIHATGTRTLTYASIRDSDACSSSGDIDVGGGTNINEANNECWNFAGNVASTIVSAANQTFEVGQAATAISQITVTTGNGTGAVTASNDLRIAIATTSVDSIVNMRWDSADATAVIGGSQACTVATGVSFEGSDSVLVVPISGVDCNNGDTITISGLNFTSFNTAVASSSALRLFLGGLTDQVADATNTAQYVAIKGTQTLANSSAGQESNKLDLTVSTVDDVELFAFRLTPNNEGASTTRIVVTLSDVKNFGCGNLGFSGEGIYIDYNSDGSVSGESATGTVACSISGGSGSLTFTFTLSTSTARDFIIRSDITGNNPENRMTLSLAASDITSRGTSSLQSLTTLGSPTAVAQFRGSTSGGGSGIPTDLPGGERPSGGGTGQGSGGGGDPEPPPPPSPPSGGGGGQGGGGGGEIPYVPELLKPIANIMKGLEGLIAMLRHC